MSPPTRRSRPAGNRTAASISGGRIDSGTTVPVSADNATEARPTAADISALLRSRPRDGDADLVRVAWIARKHRLLRAIEAATR